MCSILELKTKNGVEVCESSAMAVTEVKSICILLRPLENSCRELNGLLQIKFCRMHLKIVNMLIFFWKNKELVSEPSV